MVKTLFGVLIVVWMMIFALRYGLRVKPLLLVIAVIVVLIRLAIYRKAAH